MKTTPNFLKVLTFLLIAVGFCLAAIGWVLGRDAAEKIGTAILMPSGILWLMLMALTLQLWPVRRKAERPGGGLSALLCFLAYSFAGSGYFSEALGRALEAPFVGINPLEQAPVEVVIVLGGGGSLGANGRLQGNGSGDRMILAAQLYHQHPSMKLICTGQRIESMNSSGIDPAETSFDILVRLGVPAEAIELIGGRNTSEEMLNLGERFRNDSTRIGLLSSAWHLRRATRLAERNGLTTVPLPADFRSSPKGQAPTIGQRLESLIPNGAAFGSTSAFVKEYLGMLLGR